MDKPLIYQDSQFINRLIGALVRKARIKRGTTQSELANMIGITYQQMNKYELGVNRISAARLLLIAKALDISVADLLPEGADAADSESVSRLDLELARYFGRIANQQHRQAVCRLVRLLAEE